MLAKGTLKDDREREARHNQVAYEAACEGIVLLQNNGALPLKDKKIALYGSGARRTVKGGTGSGEVNERHSVSVEEGLIALGCNVLTKGWLHKFDAFYEERRAAWKADIKQLLKGVSFYQEFGIIASHPFRYPVSVPVEESDLFADEADTAVYVLARQAGEGKDRSDEEGDYRIDALELSDLQVLRKAYKMLVLVINIGGFCDLSFLDEIAPDAVVYLAQAGQAGGKALADILYGVCCPSGKLASTWARTYSDYPCAAEYSHYGDALQQYYREGIHVGYRYFDAMGLRPMFAFGHGLSYTSFNIDFSSPRIEGTRFIVDAKVTNCGACAGKEVVQLYVSLPASAHAEKKRLVAFQKTRELAPEASEETELCFDLKDCSYYDEERAAWIFPAGDFIVSGGNSSDALRPVAVIRSEHEAVTAQCVNICPPQPFEKLTFPETSRETPAGVPVLSFDGEKLTENRESVRPASAPSEKVQAALGKLTIRELASLVVGNPLGERTPLELPGAVGSTTGALYETYASPNILLADGPAGLRLMPEFVEVNGALKMLSIPEKYSLGSGPERYKGMLASRSDGVMHYAHATAWPCEMLLAQMWSPDLVEHIGDCVGREMEDFGVTIWLAPGMNIHRNPLCGRTFEYYSEDPLIAGKNAAALARGVQKHPGKCVTIKHFACNNSEDLRDTMNSNVEERALREIYLKGFEIAVREGHPKAVMTSYNKLNGTYTANNVDLLKTLRKEWGFDGIVMSDWNAVREGGADAVQAIRAQNDLIMPGERRQIDMLCGAVENGSLSRGELECCAGRILSIIEENTALPWD